jgi:phosphoribosylglycinamide formyltransferase 1
MPRIAVVAAEPNPNLQVLLEAHREKNLKDGELSLLLVGPQIPQDTFDKIESQKIKSHQDITDALENAVPDVVVVLDSPHGLEPTVLEKYQGRVMGLHPALAGTFPGGNAIEDAYNAYRSGEARWSGCNLHYIQPDGQAGPVVRQVVVPVEPKDTLDSFTERMRKGEEWVLLKGIKQHLYELRNEKRKAQRR